jgi:hypothetical protein
LTPGAALNVKIVWVQPAVDKQKDNPRKSKTAAQKRGRLGKTETLREVDESAREFFMGRKPALGGIPSKPFAQSNCFEVDRFQRDGFAGATKLA